MSRKGRRGRKLSKRAFKWAVRYRRGVRRSEARLMWGRRDADIGRGNRDGGRHECASRA